MQPKEKLLFVPNSVKSHIIPTFYLARLLQERYEIHYLILDSQFRQLIVDQNYIFHQSKTSHIGFSCEYLSKGKRGYKRNWFHRVAKAVKVFTTNPQYQERQKEIDSLMEQLQPKAVFLDVFGATNFIFFHKYLQQISVVFLSPMLSTHLVKGFPTLDEGSWTPIANGGVGVGKKGISKFADYWNLKLLCRRLGMDSRYKLSADNRFTHYSFAGVPELVLAPMELELSEKVIGKNQHYLGLCVDGKTNVKQLESYEGFELDDFKGLDKKIIFCSFGAYFQSLSHHQIIAAFITELIETAMGLPDLCFIVACNQVILDVVQSTIDLPENIHLYPFVPQVAVLGISDVFLSHGGLGSIKEAIYAKVPMIVYPLEPKFDNVGNAFKVAHHGLGMVGDLEHHGRNEITKSILELLGNPSYKQKIAEFGERATSKYSSEQILTILGQFIA